MGTSASLRGWFHGPVFHTPGTHCSLQNAEQYNSYKLHEEKNKEKRNRFNVIITWRCIGNIWNEPHKHPDTCPPWPLTCYTNSRRNWTGGKEKASGKWMTYRCAGILWQQLAWSNIHSKLRRWCAGWNHGPGAFAGSPSRLEGHRGREITSWSYGTTWGSQCDFILATVSRQLEHKSESMFVQTVTLVKKKIWLICV